MAFFTTSDGAALHYEVYGTGTPLIMLHGYGASAKAFDQNVPALSQKYRVITLDQRGHGDSENVSYGYHMERLSKDVEELIETFYPGSGYVFTQVHNIQANVEPEKVLAIYETAAKYR